ncbi:MAG: AraC family transcriptional regulator [Ruminiclostridium sp.]
MEMWFNYFAKEDGFPFFIQYGIHESYMFPHSHEDFCELVIVLEGTAEHRVGGQSFPVCRGDVFLLGAGSSHSYENAKGFKICNIMFRTFTALEMEESLGEIEGFSPLFLADGTSKSEFGSRLKLSDRDFETVSGIVDEMMAEYYGDKDGRKAVIMSLFTILAALLSRLYGVPCPQADIPEIKQAARILEGGYMLENPVRLARESCNYSERHFTRLFSKVYSVSPQQYLTEVRIKAACKMLKNSAAPIAEIARSCGFTDPGYFSRIFKSNTGVLPSDYRKGKKISSK